MTIDFIIILLLVLVVAANFVAGYLLWRRAKRLQIAMDELQAFIAYIDPDGAALPANIAHVLGRGKRRVLCVEILNPVELATERSKFAGPVAGIAPEYINQQVYQQTRDILLEKLQAFGVQAEVTIQSVK